MGKRLMLILACALIVGLALPAFAEVQNVKVGGDITMYGINRQNFNADSVNKADDDSSHAASIIRLRVDADLTENVSTTLRLINERDWGQEADTNSEVNVDLAYVTLKEFLYSPLTLTLGRQELHFGNDFIIGDPDRNNCSSGTSLTDEDLSSKKAFDAARATFDYDPLIVDLFWAKIDENTVVDATNDTSERDDVDLLGINARYDFGGNWSTIGDLYYFAKIDRTPKDYTLNTTNKGKIEINNIGGRVEMSPTEKLMLMGEAAYQFGQNNTDSVSAVTNLQDHQAWATQWMARYALDMKYDPVLTAIYSFYSGDNVTTDDNSEGWDPMYENQTCGHVANVLLDPSNLHVFDLKGTITPMEDLTLTADYVYFRFVKAYPAGADAITTFDQTHSANNTFDTTGESSVGSELDINLTYDYTDDVQLGLLCGWFYPGDALESVDDTDMATISEVIASVKVKF